MQYTIASVALFTALASATQHTPQHFHHRRQLNGTEPQTTLTVTATSVHTITSCAATVTNCPAKNQQSAGVVVTEVVTIATTVCPVAEAGAVSSKVISSAANQAAVTGGSIVVPTGTATAGANSGAATSNAPAVPLSTGIPVGNGNVVSVPVNPEQDTTITYTLGQGTSTRLVTTTIKKSSTATVYATKTGAEAVPTLDTGKNNAASVSGASTIQGISTSTRYVTVVPAPTVSNGANSGASALGVPGASGPGAGNCAPVTVTVALSTVTVTATPTGVVGNVAAVTAPAGNGKGSSSGEPAASDVIALSTATVVPVPVGTAVPAPYGNGTDSTGTQTKTPCSSVFPSGFISKSKPTGTGAPIAKFRN